MLFVVISGSRFHIVDTKDFKILCPSLERHALSQYATELADFIVEQIKGCITKSIQIVLVIDEWSSITNQPFLGVVAHCLFDQTYETFTIDHKLLSNKHNPSEIIAYTLTDIIQKFIKRILLLALFRTRLLKCLPPMLYSKKLESNQIGFLVIFTYLIFFFPS